MNLLDASDVKWWFGAAGLLLGHLLCVTALRFARGTSPDRGVLGPRVTRRRRAQQVGAARLLPPGSFPREPRGVDPDTAATTTYRRLGPFASHEGAKTAVYNLRGLLGLEGQEEGR